MNTAILMGMNRSNLVPELRTDKNGVTSKRWVKPDQGALSKGKGLPVPGIKRESLQGRKDRLRETFNLGSMEGNTNFERIFSEQIGSMPEPAVDLALKTLDEHQDSSRVNYAVRESIQRWDKTLPPHKTDEGLMLSLRFAAIEAVYEKYLVPSPLGNPSRADDLEEGILASLRISKDGGDGSSKRPLTSEEAETAVHAGYAAAAYELHKTNVSKQRFFSPASMYWDMFQSHSELIGVFSEFKDRLDEVTDYVYQNGGDASAARQHMRGDHMALAGGAL